MSRPGWKHFAFSQVYSLDAQGRYNPAEGGYFFVLSHSNSIKLKFINKYTYGCWCNCERRNAHMEKALRFAINNNTKKS